MKTLREKFEGLGINSYLDLRVTTGCSDSLAKQLWYGSKRNGKALPLSKRMAEILKNKTGASLDYLLS